MTAETFAQNLRAAMALATPPRVPSHLAAKMLGLPEKYAEWSPEQEREAQLITSRIAAWGWPRSSHDGPTSLPTPEELTALATALGCPVERLTVSREELEAELERLRAWRSSMIDAFEEAFTHDDYFIFDILRDAYNKLESEAQP